MKIYQCKINCVNFLTSRNGYNEKTINSKYEHFDVSIPRDGESTFEPQLVIFGTNIKSIVSVNKDFHGIL